MKKFSLFAVLCCFVFSVFAQYTVGDKTITYTDPARSNRSVGLQFRYPGTNTAVANGQFPFVIFAHGFSMNQTPYLPYADSLAKRGYIVGLLTTETGLSPSHANFAQDLVFMYGKLISESNTNSASIFYQKVLPKGSFGGHSMGGGSTVLSAQYGNPQQCSFTFAAATTNPSSITAAKFMTKPYLAFGGSLDCIAPVSTNQKPMYDSSAASCKFLINILNGLHCQYGNASTPCSFGEGTSGCASSSLTRQQQIDKTLFYLVPYLDYYLKGDCAAWTLFESRYSSNTVDALQRSCTNSIPSNQGITGNLSFCTGQSTTLTANPAGFNYVWNNNSTANTLNVNTAGAYSVVVGNGVCSLPAATATVTQKSTPATPSAISLNDTVCTGIAGITASVTNDPIATQYNWTLPSGWSITQGNNSNSIQATSGTSGGTVQVTAQNSCGTSAASQKAVTVLPSNLGTAGAISGSQTLCKTASGNYSIATVTGATSYTWTYPSGWNVSGASNANTITLTPTASAVSGQITVAAANNCGNSTPASLSVQVNAPPLLGAINGPTTVCVGNNIGYKVDITGPGIITWTNPGFQVVSGAGTDSIYVLAVGPTGTNSLSVSAQNNCGTATPASQSVTVVDTPSITIANIGNYIAINSGGGGTVVWFINGQQQSVGNDTIFAIATGDYQALVTNANGCSGWSNVVYYEIVGVEKVTTNAAIKIYPNPAKDIAVIHINSTQLGEDLKVTDANGRVVYKQTITDKEIVLQVKDYAKGLYLISIGDEKQKFVVE
ncbi:MAG: T9SS type A sorting domain-containing protein [Chitinophagales bacterium]|nr:T9SS type A sorting domain-containing protein [Chitinophagales bacterium]